MAVVVRFLLSIVTAISYVSVQLTSGEKLNLPIQDPTPESLEYHKAHSDVRQKSGTCNKL